MFFNDTAPTEIYTSFPTRRSSDLKPRWDVDAPGVAEATLDDMVVEPVAKLLARHEDLPRDEFVTLVEEVDRKSTRLNSRSRQYLVCRLLLEKTKIQQKIARTEYQP